MKRKKWPTRAHSLRQQCDDFLFDVVDCFFFNIFPLLLLISVERMDTWFWIGFILTSYLDMNLPQWSALEIKILLVSAAMPCDAFRLNCRLLLLSLGYLCSYARVVLLQHFSAWCWLERCIVFLALCSDIGSRRMFEWISPWFISIPNIYGICKRIFTVIQMHHFYAHCYVKKSNSSITTWEHYCGYTLHCTNIALYFYCWMKRARKTRSQTAFH